MALARDPSCFHILLDNPIFIIQILCLMSMDWVSALSNTSGLLSGTLNIAIHNNFCSQLQIIRLSDPGAGPIEQARDNGHLPYVFISHLP